MVYSDKSNKKKNHAVEGLRGMLACMVLGFHVYKMGEKAGFYPSTTSRIIDQVGPYGVCVFFCVSGLLIVQTLLSKDDLGEFFRNRAARIYPVFLILHLTIFALGPWAGYAWMGRLRNDPVAYVANFLSNLFFLPGLLDLPIAQKNAWSLSFEAVFYLVAAAMYWSVKRLPMAGGKAVFLMAAGTAGVVLWTHPISGFFLVGVGTFWLVGNGKLKPLSDWISVPALAIGLSSYPFFLPVSMAATFVFFAAVVAGKGLLGHFLSTTPMRWLGKISYSLYLIHPFAMDPLRSVLSRVELRHPAFPSGILFCVLGPIFSIALAYVSFALVERKLTRFLFEERRPRPVLVQS